MGLDFFCMLCGDTQNFSNTCVCPSAHRADGVMVIGPRETTAAHSSGKTAAVNIGHERTLETYVEPNIFNIWVKN